MALRTSVRAARPDRALSLTPTASFGVSTQTQITLALGVDLRLRLEERQLDLPLPLMFSVGFDALNMGCQGLPMCHIGAAGVHGEVGAIIARHHTYGDWSLSVGLDQDIRFGPRSNTSLLAGVRWTPARQNQ